MILGYHPDASAELIEAAQFYESRQIGLGHRFLDAVETSLATLLRNPQLGSPGGLRRRRYLVHGFPYVIVYREDGAFLHVLAVAHTSRRPGYWRSRDG